MYIGKLRNNLKIIYIFICMNVCIYIYIGKFRNNLKICATPSTFGCMFIVSRASGIY